MPSEPCPGHLSHHHIIIHPLRGYPSPHQPPVTVVIPNWNGQRFLPACFESLRAQRFREFEVVLVDNGSSDESVPLTAAHYPEVRVIALPENAGFAAAVNQGIRA